MLQTPCYLNPALPTPKVATDPEWRSPLREDPAFFSEPVPESKICETPDVDPEPLFIFSSRTLCGLHIWHFLSKNIGEFRLP